MKPLTEGLNMEGPSRVGLAEEYQKQSHEYVKKTMDQNKGTSYQDATNTWMFLKLADLQLKINKLMEWKLLHKPLK